MNSYTIKGKALACTVRANSLEEATDIFKKPLLEVFDKLTSVCFERKESQK